MSTSKSKDKDRTSRSSRHDKPTLVEVAPQPYAPTATRAQQPVLRRGESEDYYNPRPEPTDGQGYVESPTHYAGAVPQQPTQQQQQQYTSHMGGGPYGGGGGGPPPPPQHGGMGGQSSRGQHNGAQGHGGYTGGGPIYHAGYGEPAHYTSHSGNSFSVPGPPPSANQQQGYYHPPPASTSYSLPPSGPSGSGYPPTLQHAQTAPQMQQGFPNTSYTHPVPTPHAKPPRRDSTSSSSSSSYVDISRSYPIPPVKKNPLGALRTFFTAPSESRRRVVRRKSSRTLRRQKSKGKLGRRHSSSSSEVDSDLAYGTGYLRRRRSKRRGSPRRHGQGGQGHGYSRSPRRFGSPGRDGRDGRRENNPPAGGVPLPGLHHSSTMPGVLSGGFPIEAGVVAAGSAAIAAGLSRKDSKNEGKGKKDAEKEILKLGEDLHNLAKRQNKYDLEEAARRGRVNVVRHDQGRHGFGPKGLSTSPPRGIPSNKMDKRKEKRKEEGKEDDGWETSDSDDTSSSESVDDALGYGGENTYQSWKWREPVHPPRRNSQLPSHTQGRDQHYPHPPTRKSTIVDPKLFGPQNSLQGFVTRPEGFGQVDDLREDGRTPLDPPTVKQTGYFRSPLPSVNPITRDNEDARRGKDVEHSRRGVSPRRRGKSDEEGELQHVFPVPTRDPGVFDARGTPRQERQGLEEKRPSFHARTDSLPLRQPKPMSPVRREVYDGPSPEVSRKVDRREKKEKETSTRSNDLALGGLAGAALAAAIAAGMSSPEIERYQAKSKSKDEGKGKGKEKERADDDQDREIDSQRMFKDDMARRSGRRPETGPDRRESYGFSGAPISAISLTTTGHGAGGAPGKVDPFQYQVDAWEDEISTPGDSDRKGKKPAAHERIAARAAGQHRDSGSSTPRKYVDDINRDKEREREYQEALYSSSPEIMRRGDGGTNQALERTDSEREKLRSEARPLHERIAARAAESNPDTGRNSPRQQKRLDDEAERRIAEVLATYAPSASSSQRRGDVEVRSVEVPGDNLSIGQSIERGNTPEIRVVERKPTWARDVSPMPPSRRAMEYSPEEVGTGSPRWQRGEPVEATTLSCVKGTEVDGNYAPPMVRTASDADHRYASMHDDYFGSKPSQYTPQGRGRSRTRSPSSEERGRGRTRSRSPAPPHSRSASKGDERPIVMEARSPLNKSARDGSPVDKYDARHDRDRKYTDRDAQMMYEEERHFTAPIAAAAIGAAIAAVHRDEDRHRGDYHEHRDPIQEDADRYYREMELARKLAKQHDNDPVPRVVTPPAMEHHHESPTKEAEKYGVPNADFEFDHEMTPDELPLFSPVVLRKSFSFPENFDDKMPFEPRMLGLDRPILNLVKATPRPEQQAFKLTEPQPRSRSQSRERKSESSRSVEVEEDRPFYGKPVEIADVPDEEPTPTSRDIPTITEPEPSKDDTDTKSVSWGTNETQHYVPITPYDEQRNPHDSSIPSSPETTRATTGGLPHSHAHEHHKEKFEGKKDKGKGKETPPKRPKPKSLWSEDLAAQILQREEVAYNLANASTIGFADGDEGREVPREEVEELAMERGKLFKDPELESGEAFEYRGIVVEPEAPRRHKSKKSRKHRDVVVDQEEERGRPAEGGTHRERTVSPPAVGPKPASPRSMPGGFGDKEEEAEYVVQRGVSPPAYDASTAIYHQPSEISDGVATGFNTAVHSMVGGGVERSLPLDLSRGVSDESFVDVQPPPHSRGLCSDESFVVVEEDKVPEEMKEDETMVVTVEPAGEPTESFAVVDTHGHEQSEETQPLIAATPVGLERTVTEMTEMTEITEEDAFVTPLEEAMTPFDASIEDISAPQIEDAPLGGRLSGVDTTFIPASEEMNRETISGEPSFEVVEAAKETQLPAAETSTEAETSKSEKSKKKKKKGKKGAVVVEESIPLGDKEMSEKTKEECKMAEVLLEEAVPVPESSSFPTSREIAEEIGEVGKEEGRNEIVVDLATPTVEDQEIVVDLATPAADENSKQTEVVEPSKDRGTLEGETTRTIIPPTSAEVVASEITEPSANIESDILPQTRGDGGVGAADARLAALDVLPAEAAAEASREIMEKEGEKERGRKGSMSDFVAVALAGTAAAVAGIANAIIPGSKPQEVREEARKGDVEEEMPTGLNKKQSKAWEKKMEKRRKDVEASASARDTSGEQTPAQIEEVVPEETKEASLPSSEIVDTPAEVVEQIDKDIDETPLQDAIEVADTPLDVGEPAPKAITDRGEAAEYYNEASKDSADAPDQLTTENVDTPDIEKVGQASTDTVAEAIPATQEQVSSEPTNASKTQVTASPDAPTEAILEEEMPKGLNKKQKKAWEKKQQKLKEQREAASASTSNDASHEASGAQTPAQTEPLVQDVKKIAEPVIDVLDAPASIQEEVSKEIEETPRQHAVESIESTPEAITDRGEAAEYYNDAAKDVASPQADGAVEITPQVVEARSHAEKADTERAAEDVEEEMPKGLNKKQKKAWERQQQKLREERESAAASAPATGTKTPAVAEVEQALGASKEIIGPSTERPATIIVDAQPPAPEGNVANFDDAVKAVNDNVEAKLAADTSLSSSADVSTEASGMESAGPLEEEMPKGLNKKQKKAWEKKRKEAEMQRELEAASAEEAETGATSDTIPVVEEPSTDVVESTSELAIGELASKDIVDPITEIASEQPGVDEPAAVIVDALTPAPEAGTVNFDDAVRAIHDTAHEPSSVPSEAVADLSETPIQSSSDVATEEEMPKGLNKKQKKAWEKARKEREMQRELEAAAAMTAQIEPLSEAAVTETIQPVIVEEQSKIAEPIPESVVTEHVSEEPALTTAVEEPATIVLEAPSPAPGAGMENFDDAVTAVHDNIETPHPASADISSEASGAENPGQSGGLIEDEMPKGLNKKQKKAWEKKKKEREMQAEIDAAAAQVAQVEAIAEVIPIVAEEQSKEISEPILEIGTEPAAVEEQTKEIVIVSEPVTLREQSQETIEYAPEPTVIEHPVLEVASEPVSAEEQARGITERVIEPVILEQPAPEIDETPLETPTETPDIVEEEPQPPKKMNKREKKAWDKAQREAKALAEAEATAPAAPSEPVPVIPEEYVVPEVLPTPVFEDESGAFATAPMATPLEEHAPADTSPNEADTVPLSIEDATALAASDPEAAPRDVSLSIEDAAALAGDPDPELPAPKLTKKEKKALEKAQRAKGLEVESSTATETEERVAVPVDAFRDVQDAGDLVSSNEILETATQLETPIGTPVEEVEIGLGGKKKKKNKVQDKAVELEAESVPLPETPALGQTVEPEFRPETTTLERQIDPVPDTVVDPVAQTLALLSGISRSRATPVAVQESVEPIEQQVESPTDDDDAFHSAEEDRGRSETPTGTVGTIDDDEFKDFHSTNGDDAFQSPTNGHQAEPEFAVEEQPQIVENIKEPEVATDEDFAPVGGKKKKKKKKGKEAAGGSSGVSPEDSMTEQESFLANAGTLGAGVGLAAAVQENRDINSGNEQHNADAAGRWEPQPSEVMKMVKEGKSGEEEREGTVIGVDDGREVYAGQMLGRKKEEDPVAETVKLLQGIERSGQPRSQDILNDPEIVERVVMPAIDPQFGDLLPLPPRDSPPNEEVVGGALQTSLPLTPAIEAPAPFQPLVSIQEQNEPREHTEVVFEIDPEIQERKIHPSVDPQYGDLLPLPPSQPGSPARSLEEEILATTLPDSPPESPVNNRLSIDSSSPQTPRKKDTTHLMRSPSISAVPLKFLLGHRSTPSSPVVGSSTRSPLLTSPTRSEFTARPKSRHSWEGSKELQPLHLLERRHSRGSSLNDFESRALAPLLEMVAGQNDRSLERGASDAVLVEGETGTPAEAFATALSEKRDEEEYFAAPAVQETVVDISQVGLLTQPIVAAEQTREISDHPFDADSSVIAAPTVAAAAEIAQSTTTLPPVNEPILLSVHEMPQDTPIASTEPPTFVEEEMPKGLNKKQRKAWEKKTQKAREAAQAEVGNNKSATVETETELKTVVSALPANAPSVLETDRAGELTGAAVVQPQIVVEDVASHTPAVVTLPEISAEAATMVDELEPSVARNVPLPDSSGTATPMDSNEAYATAVEEKKAEEYFGVPPGEEASREIPAVSFSEPVNSGIEEEMPKGLNKKQKKAWEKKMQKVREEALAAASAAESGRRTSAVEGGPIEVVMEKEVGESQPLMETPFIEEGKDIPELAQLAPPEDVIESRPLKIAAEAPPIAVNEPLMIMKDEQVSESPGEKGDVDSSAFETTSSKKLKKKKGKGKEVVAERAGLEAQSPFEEKKGVSAVERDDDTVPTEIAPPTMLPALVANAFSRPKSPFLEEEMPKGLNKKQRKAWEKKQELAREAALASVAAESGVGSPVVEDALTEAVEDGAKDIAEATESIPGVAVLEVPVIVEPEEVSLKASASQEIQSEIQPPAIAVKVPAETTPAANEPITIAEDMPKPTVVETVDEEMPKGLNKKQRKAWEKKQAAKVASGSVSTGDSGAQTPSIENRAEVVVAVQEKSQDVSGDVEHDVPAEQIQEPVVGVSQLPIISEQSAPPTVDFESVLQQVPAIETASEPSSFNFAPVEEIIQPAVFEDIAAITTALPETPLETLTESPFESASSKKSKKKNKAKKGATLDSRIATPVPEVSEDVSKELVEDKPAGTSLSPATEDDVVKATPMLEIGGFIETPVIELAQPILPEEVITERPTQVVQDTAIPLQIFAEEACAPDATGPAPIVEPVEEPIVERAVEDVAADMPVLETQMDTDRELPSETPIMSQGEEEEMPMGLNKKQKKAWEKARKERNERRAAEVAAAAVVVDRHLDEVPQGPTESEVIAAMVPVPETPLETEMQLETTMESRADLPVFQHDGPSEVIMATTCDSPTPDQPVIQERVVAEIPEIPEESAAMVDELEPSIARNVPLPGPSGTATPIDSTEAETNPDGKKKKKKKGKQGAVSDAFPLVPEIAVPSATIVDTKDGIENGTGNLLTMEAVETPVETHQELRPATSEVAVLDDTPADAPLSQDPSSIAEESMAITDHFEPSIARNVILPDSTPATPLESTEAETSSAFEAAAKKSKKKKKGKKSAILWDEEPSTASPAAQVIVETPKEIEGVEETPQIDDDTAAPESGAVIEPGLVSDDVVNAPSAQMPVVAEAPRTLETLPAGSSGDIVTEEISSTILLSEDITKDIPLPETPALETSEFDSGLSGKADKKKKKGKKNAVVLEEEPSTATSVPEVADQTPIKVPDVLEPLIKQHVDVPTEETITVSERILHGSVVQVDHPSTPPDAEHVDVEVDIQEQPATIMKSVEEIGSEQISEGTSQPQTPLQVSVSINEESGDSSDKTPDPEPVENTEAPKTAFLERSASGRVSISGTEESGVFEKTEVAGARSYGDGGVDRDEVVRGGVNEEIVSGAGSEESGVMVEEEVMPKGLNKKQRKAWEKGIEKRRRDRELVEADVKVLAEATEEAVEEIVSEPLKESVETSQEVEVLDEWKPERKLSKKEQKAADKKRRLQEEQAEIEAAESAAVAAISEPPPQNVQQESSEAEIVDAMVPVPETPMDTERELETPTRSRVEEDWAAQTRKLSKKEQQAADKKRRQEEDRAEKDAIEQHQQELIDPEPQVEMPPATVEIGETSREIAVKATVETIETPLETPAEDEWAVPTRKLSKKEQKAVDRKRREEEERAEKEAIVKSEQQVIGSETEARAQEEAEAPVESDETSRQVIEEPTIKNIELPLETPAVSDWAPTRKLSKKEKKALDKKRKEADEEALLLNATAAMTAEAASAAAKLVSQDDLISELREVEDSSPRTPVEDTTPAVEEGAQETPLQVTSRESLEETPIESRTDSDSPPANIKAKRRDKGKGKAVEAVDVPSDKTMVITSSIGEHDRSSRAGNHTLDKAITYARTPSPSTGIFQQALEKVVEKQVRQRDLQENITKEAVKGSWSFSSLAEEDKPDSPWSASRLPPVLEEENVLEQPRTPTSPTRARSPVQRAIGKEDTGYVSGGGSPSPKRRSWFDPEYVRDSGVQLREKRSSDSQRSLREQASTDDVLARRSWPPAEEERETVDLRRKKRASLKESQSSPYDKITPTDIAKAATGLGIAGGQKRSLSKSPALSESPSREFLLRKANLSQTPSSEEKGPSSTSSRQPSAIRDLERSETRSASDRPPVRQSSLLESLHDRTTSPRSFSDNIHNPRTRTPITPREREEYYNRGASTPTSERRASGAAGSGFGSTSRPTSVISNRSVTPSLRRVSGRASTDLRALSKSDLTQQHAKTQPRDTDTDSGKPSPAVSDVNNSNSSAEQSAPPNANEGRQRVKGMAEVYNGFGEGRMGSPRSPTRPHSMRRKQSMQLLDMQAQMAAMAEELAAARLEKAVILQAKEAAERNLSEARREAGRAGEYKAQAEEVRGLLESMTLRNTDLTRQTLDLQAQLELRDNGAEAAIAAAVAAAIASKESELASLRQRAERLSHDCSGDEREIEELEGIIAGQKQEIAILKSQQHSTSATGTPDYLADFQLDDRYFEQSCQKLFRGVWRWIHAFSDRRKHSAASLEAIKALPDQRIYSWLRDAFEGNPTTYLADLEKRRLVLMSLTMALFHHYIFSKHFFGLDPVQEEASKVLEMVVDDSDISDSEFRTWRATQFCLFSKSRNYSTQRNSEVLSVTESVLHKLSQVLPQPGTSPSDEQRTRILVEDLKIIVKKAAELSNNMRRQRAKYVWRQSEKAVWGEKRSKAPERFVGGSMTHAEICVQFMELHRVDEKLGDGGIEEGDREGLMRERAQHLESLVRDFHVISEAEVSQPGFKLNWDEMLRRMEEKNRRIEEKGMGVRLTLFPMVVREGDAAGEGKDRQIIWKALVKPVDLKISTQGGKRRTSDMGSTVGGSVMGSERGGKHARVR